MKYAFIREQAETHPLSRLCQMLDVSRSGYHAWLQRPRCGRADSDRQLLVQIRRVHLEHRQAYGSVKTWQVLRSRGIAGGKHRVARLRREHGIEARRRSRQRLTVEHHKMAAPSADLVLRHFSAPRPNHVWAGDMTFIRTREGWLHLAVLLDLFSRAVVGFAMDQRPGTELHVGALQMALRRRKPAPGLIHHTDRGVQYRSVGYRDVLVQHGLRQSMNGSTRPQDNAVAESFFSNLKNELIHHCDFRTRAEAREAITDYIELFYNQIRIHQSLGYRTPAQFERQWRDA